MDIGISKGVSALFGKLLKKISYLFVTVGLTVICKVACNNSST